MHLQKLIRHFHDNISLPIGKLLPSNSIIQGIILDSGVAVTALANYLEQHAFIVKPICSPTVSKGQERVRICLHGHNTETQVDDLIKLIHSFFSKYYSKSKL